MVISFAVQPSSQLPALPSAFAVDEGHLPLPGASPVSVATQLSTSDSMPDAVPGQPDVLANADENFASALVRHAGSTAVFLAFAFDWQPIFALIFLPAAFCRDAAHFCAGVAPASAELALVATNATTPSVATILLNLMSAILISSIPALAGASVVAVSFERPMRSRRLQRMKDAAVLCAALTPWPRCWQ